MTFEVNPILACDFYKVGHVFQYPKNTEVIYSNFTPRSNRLAPIVAGKQLEDVVCIGYASMVQEFLIESFNKNFFSKPVDEVVAEFDRRNNTSLGEGSVNSDHIRALHAIGFLPLEIKTLPEGTVTKCGIPHMTVRNTRGEDFQWITYWVTNALETLFSTEAWKISTNASIALAYRRILQMYALETGTPLDFVLWQGHDFSMRGMSGIHDAARSGVGHLAFFLGTDTIPAIQYAEEYFGAKGDFIGGSVPATEHSVMCAGGFESELETFRRITQDVYPSGIVSIVSDTWDFWNVLTVIAPKLKNVIMNRTPDALGNAKVVFRPDSGDPVEILCGIEIENVDTIDEAADIMIDEEVESTPHGECGSNVVSRIFRVAGKLQEVSVNLEWNRYDKQYYFYDGFYGLRSKDVELTPQQKGAVEVLWNEFGGTLTEKGYRMLDSHVGLIYGDSITPDRAYEILRRLKDKGFASGNVVFGIGSYTYQYSTRDTFGFAMKATYGVFGGEGRELFKDPITDRDANGNSVKKSAKGLLRVEYEGGKFVLYDQQTPEQEQQGALRTIYKDGQMFNQETLGQIRTRAASFI